MSAVGTKTKNFKYLCELKARMGMFSTIEERLRLDLALCQDKKEQKLIEKKLNEHLASFKTLEDELVEQEKNMIDVSIGLYKGVAIEVTDKTLTKIPLYFRFQNLNNHVGYIGTTRVGKTKNMISDIYQLIKAGWDLLIVDPKGGVGQEIVTETIQSALEANRPDDFKYYSPMFVNESEYANLLFGMDDEGIASLIRIFAESLSNDGFFSGVVYENTLAVLKAFTFIQEATDPFGEHTRMLEEQEMKRYIALKNTKDGNQKILVDRWNRVSNPNELHILGKQPKKGKSFEYKPLDASGSLYQNRSMITFKKLAYYTTFETITELNDYVKSFIFTPPVEKIGIEKYMHIERLRAEANDILSKVLSTDKTNFSKIAKTHSVLMSQLAYGGMGDVFSGVGINPLSNRLLSENKGLICVVQPYPMMFKSASNMTVMTLLKMVEFMMGLVGASGRGNKRRLAILIDEAGAVMYKKIEDLFNKVGGLGASIFVYTQTDEDYTLSLGSQTNAKVIMDNVNTTITMRMNEPDSRKKAAEALGTIRKHQSAYMSSTNGMGRFSIGNEDEDIAEAKDIKELRVGTGYVQHNGKAYLVDFPYVKGIKSPIKMPYTHNENNLRYLAKLEEELLNQLHEIESLGSKKWVDE